ncbi:MAG: hypothetical protein H6Q49_1109 [Deltaproteobacteria bacterium]|jgi:hypothetical protein|nr:hypothetical protein [Deltaproteobacteria bacterium]
MGKPMNGSGTQAKERARQQKQRDKELKRMLTRQKKTFAKMPAPNARLDNTETLLAGAVIQSAD